VDICKNFKVSQFKDQMAEATCEVLKNANKRGSRPNKLGWIKLVKENCEHRSRGKDCQLNLHLNKTQGVLHSMTTWLNWGVQPLATKAELS